ncbi:MAG: hypothetical protein JNK72_20575 [Myxococcales bacterium]|nr:hypothetical protein [Myxococcales bacterium]
MSDPRDLSLPSLRPSATELLDAAREHLVKNVLPALGDPALRFKTLVAAHVLGVVSRELSGGLAAREAIAEARDALLGEPGSDPALCAAIARGDFDAQPMAEALMAHLEFRTETALAAWNPAFLARVKAR